MTATYPAYNDAITASAWSYGLAKTLAAGGTVKPYAGTAAGWYVRTMPLSLAPGTYYITEVGFMASNTAVTDMGGARCSVFQFSGSDLVPVPFDDGSTYLDLSADITVGDASNKAIGPTTIASVPLTIVAGIEYQLAFAVEGIAGRANNKPAIMAHNDVNVRITTYNGDGTTFPVTHTPTADATSTPPRGYIKFTTAARKIGTGVYAAAKNLIIPSRTDGDFCIKFENAVVADGEAFTAALSYDNGGVDGVRTTLVLDMGATDQVTFGSANVPLNAVTPEAGDTIDMMAQMRADDKADLFYSNKSVGQGPAGAATDIATFSHATLNDAAADGSRGQEYSITQDLDYLDMTGTAAVDAVETGFEPLIIFGDSQCDNTGAVKRLGYYLPTSFTYPRIAWYAWISGNRLCTTVGGTHTAGYLRYKSTTAGQGDLCEMQKVVFCYCGFGVNDVNGLIATSGAARNPGVALILYRANEIFDDLQDHTNQLLTISLPPFSLDVSATEEEAFAIRDQLNPGLEGLTHGVRGAYYNPHYVMTNGLVTLTGPETVPQFRAEYTSDSGLHYNAAGAAFVANNAARAFETKLVGAMWGNPARRWARKHGLLLP